MKPIRFGPTLEIAALVEANTRAVCWFAITYTVDLQIIKSTRLKVRFAIHQAIVSCVCAPVLQSVRAYNK
jgi:hypothetical protein